MVSSGSRNAERGRPGAVAFAFPRARTDEPSIGTAWPRHDSARVKTVTPGHLGLLGGGAEELSRRRIIRSLLDSAAFILIQVWHEGHYHQGRGRPATRAGAHEASVAESLRIREVAPPPGGHTPRHGRGGRPLRDIPARDARRASLARRVDERRSRTPRQAEAPVKRGSAYWINLEPSSPPELGKVHPGSSFRI